LDYIKKYNFCRLGWEPANRVDELIIADNRLANVKSLKKICKKDKKSLLNWCSTAEDLFQYSSHKTNGILKVFGQFKLLGLNSGEQSLHSTINAGESKSVLV
jgi:hypothetical protein